MRHVRNRAAGIIATTLVAIAFAVHSPLDSQVLTGVIRDTTSTHPIQSAQIKLLTESGEVVSSFVSGEDGSFLIGAAEWGTYVVSIMRIGYRPVALGGVRLLPDDTLHADYWMTPLAVEMDPVVVEAEAAVLVAHARYLQSEGYYHRERATTGRHLDPAKVENRRHTARYISDFLVGLPGVRVRANYFYAGSRPSVRLGCGVPTYYVDGDRLIGNMWVDPYDVLAMEIYDGPGQTPQQYGGRCAVVVWTRHRAETRARP